MKVSIIEDLNYNNPLSIFYFKLKKNIKSPTIFFDNFIRKTINMIKLLFLIVFKNQHKKNKKKNKEKLIQQLNIIVENFQLIKNYYRDDNEELEKEIKSDIRRHNYTN